MISALTCAVSPAQNSPFLLAQIVRRTETVRWVKVQNENSTHTKRVDQEIILDLVYIPRGRVNFTREKQILMKSYRKSTFRPAKPTSRSSFDM